MTADNANSVAPLLPPFPWFGGKRLVANVVWERFGDEKNYVEPFAGGLAVLLGRPTPPRIETINDKDAYVSNFWRAVRHDPDQVAHYAEDRTDEVELHARHRWLHAHGPELREKLIGDVDYFDAQIAGWWVWGVCLWVGEGWCPSRPVGGTRRPHLGRPQGVQRLAHKGTFALKSPRPQLNRRGVHSVHMQNLGIEAYMRLLAERLRDVRVLCGDWDRCTSYSALDFNGLTALFLDPPYPHDAGRDPEIYGIEDAQVWYAVREWCIANGDNPKLRIALCGYEGEHNMPDSWTVHAWKTQGGFGAAKRGTNGMRNRHRERIWFSPHCLAHGIGSVAAENAYIAKAFGETET